VIFEGNMKDCPKCGTQIQDAYELCYDCNYEKKYGKKPKKYYCQKCDKKLIFKQRLCSDCFREEKKKKVEERAEKGLCLSCGKDLSLEKSKIGNYRIISYCSKCNKIYDKHK